MVLDLLLLFVIIILLISIEEKTITNYKQEIINKSEDLNILTESLIVDQLISDCNYFATIDTYTKICHKNKIEIKNINYLPSNICRITLNELEYLNKGTVRNTHKRGVVYREKFGILEVGFCE